MARRTWTDGSGLPLSASNLNGMEADIASKPSVGATAPNPAEVPVWFDTSSLPPTLKGWNGTSWVSIVSGTSATYA